MTVDLTDDLVAELVDEIAVRVRGGDSIERAVTRLRRWGDIPEEYINAARRRFEEQVGVIRQLRDPLALVETEYRTGGWYTGPLRDDLLWWQLRDRLARVLDSDAIDEVDRASTRVVSLLRPPGAPEIRSRGLVLGYVQSGKTTSLMAVIAKAAAAGYRMVIVLSGITDSLRSQTQQRLDEQLVGDNPAWHWLTYNDADFNEPPRNAAGLMGDPHKRLLAVVKKNPARLRRLVRFIDSAGEPVLRECPILVIDDEADQASIDVGRDGRRSTINRLIRRILDKPKAAYVAYTATPFANLLVDPGDFEGLYPRDFIVSLERPKAYFGPEKIFGREPLAADAPDTEIDDGLDVVRHVLPDEVPLVQPPARGGNADWSPVVTESLAAALRWFVLATAARRVREGRPVHSTMLVHTTMRVSAHDALAEALEAHLGDLRRAIVAGDPATLRSLEQQWQEESTRLPAGTMGERKVDWVDVQTHLLDVMTAVRVIVDNSRSVQRLSYDPADPAPVIAVGGNTLARGLTLSGLVCSYFVRASNAYDTLLQMGRWFGYRPGYGDLVRIWMTEELESWFYDLATVEEEIRQDIRRYEIEQCRPDEVPVKIRTHPAMMITAAAKMRAAVDAEVSFSTTRQQTILFHHRDADWLRHNINATRRLLDAAVKTVGVERGTLPDGRHVMRGVPAELILGFLHDYRFHEESYRLRPDLLERYIAAENALGALKTWSVVVVGDQRGDKGILYVGGGITAHRIHRSRLYMPSRPYANIKTLVSRIDRVADLPITRTEAVAAAGGDSDDKLRTLREDHLGTVGLLCLYPIAADSVPRHPECRPAQPGGKVRVPLDAVDDVIGVGLFFPTGVATRGIRYKSVDLSAQVPEPPDEADLVEELDRLDEEAAMEQEGSRRRSTGVRT